MEYTLLVMAGGMGSRFGGLKQIEPIGPNGEFLIDYSIYDAIKAGFTRVIFVINKENETLFKQTIGARLEGKIKIEYAYQELSDLPGGYNPPKERTKPWGTGHAIYSARELLPSSFAVINADDFYGYNAYEILMDFLKNNQDRTHYLAITYKVQNTLSDNGSVKRGIAKVENGILNQIIESNVEMQGNIVIAKPLEQEIAFQIEENDTATVNLFAFTPNFLRGVLDKFPEFLDVHLNNLNSEYLIPDILTKQIEEKSATVYVKTVADKWHGMTYRQDKESVKMAINSYIKEGKYPEKLWE